MNDYEFMSIKEMRKHNWCVNWSGGKDSTATIIAMLKYNVPIKNVNYVRMMYDNEHPATLPEISDFVDNCICRFKNQYGLKVNVVESEPFINILKKKYKRCKHKEKNGTIHGFDCLCMFACAFKPCKVKAAKSVQNEDDFEMIGYCIDEPKRYKRLNYPKQESILCTLDITQDKAKHICKINNMLAPTYTLGLGRDGCWFCPASNKANIAYIKEHHPRYVELMYKSFSRRPEHLLYPNTNNWIKEYMWDKYM